tara:strand:+ start:2245 stop:2424 length:180 start_codon:yes stop_codon:yes gene_type:complete
MANELERELLNEVQILKTKLVVRACQYDIAKEGLQTIVESNDPMGIAETTLKAMEDCVP